MVEEALLFHLGHQRFYLGCGAIEFDQQETSTVRVAGMDRGFGGLDGEVVHHLDCGGQDSRGDDVAYCGSGSVGRIEGGEQGLNDFRTLYDAEHNFRGDAERSFRADKHTGKIVSRRVERVASELHERAVGQHDFESENMGGGKAVLEAVRTAGVLRNIAANACKRIARTDRGHRSIRRERRVG